MLSKNDSFFCYHSIFVTCVGCCKFRSEMVKFDQQSTRRKPQKRKCLSFASFNLYVNKFSVQHMYLGDLTLKYVKDNFFGKKNNNNNSYNC